jgi:hypothetical protein
MKKLIRNSVAFLIPILLVLVILPVNNRLKYQGLSDDCSNHGIWLHDRIHINETAIDIAFLGSSHTSNNINSQTAVNLGYCRFGRNFSYALLKEILSAKSIKHLVLEVDENEDRYSHPIFPFIASSKDVMLPNPFFNRDIFADMWMHLAYKVELLQDEIYKHEKAVPICQSNYGFEASPDTASVVLLDETKLKRSKVKKPLSQFEQRFHGNFARVYLKKIAKICAENNIQITFLYLPSYGRACHGPSEYEEFNKYGKILITPNYILENKSNWFDENHLNQNGAKELSVWLSEQINNGLL